MAPNAERPLLSYGSFHIRVHFYYHTHTSVLMMLMTPLLVVALELLRWFLNDDMINSVKQQEIHLLLLAVTHGSKLEDYLLSALAFL
jgi:hypothetical protein